MTYDDIVKEYGTVKAAAKALGTGTKGIYKWRSHGINFDIQCRIEVITGGELKADLAKLSELKSIA